MDNIVSSENFPNVDTAKQRMSIMLFAQSDLRPTFDEGIA